MKTYIRKNIKGYYIEVPEEIDAEYWEGQIGTTYDNFLENKWILLSDEQLTFHQEHPDASIKEVIEMELTPVPERTLSDAKREKIESIDRYDASWHVNSFKIGEKTMWLNVEQREQIATQIKACEDIRRETMTRWFEGTPFTFALSVWKQMLTALEVYSGDAINVTEGHKAAVEALDSIEAVDAYDAEAGYPARLEFNM